MAAYNKFNCFVEDLGEGVHNLTSDATCTPTVALSAAANAPVATNTILANLTTITPYTNLPSSRVITVTSSTQNPAGTYAPVWVDLVLTASGAVSTFRYVSIYNEDPTSPADPLICWFDYAGDVTLANLETFTIDFGATIFTLV